MFRLYLFGSPVLTKDGEQVNIRRKRGKALLAYVALQDRPTSRETLATLFWAEYDQSTAFTNLRRELARLKADVGKGLILADRQTISINPEAAMWLDTRAFEAGVASIETAQLAEAFNLYTNDFMAGFTLADCPEFDEWQRFQSESLRAALAKGLQHFITASESSGDFEAAIEAGRRWLLLDTLHEPAHRALMRLYALAGQRSNAIRQYHICAQTLEVELGVEPEEATKALLEVIQNGQIGPPATAETVLEQPVEAVEEAAPAKRHNLPRLPDSFIGRSGEIKEIHHYLLETNIRLLTLRGLGGTGKTRLALEAVGKLVETAHFPDGLFFVSLAGIEHVDSLIPAIAEAIHFPLSQADPPLEQLINFLSKRDMLLLLDNFEHLTNGADQLSILLQQCHQLKLLVTSRHQLNLLGEQLLILEGLPVTAGHSSQNSATRLFEERAIQITPHLDLKTQAPFIRAICRLVEGLPLAIEMCAAWIQTLSCQEILAEIQQGLDLLETNRADIPSRHKSIRAVFQSSFNLLNPSEQQALLALSVFRGSFNHTAAREVAGASVARLRGLVEKSMLGTFGETAERRYQLHSLLRQFARERLTAEQLAEGDQRHAYYYAGLLNELGHKTCSMESEQIVLTVSIESDNLRSLWHWLGRQIEDENQPTPVYQLIPQILPAWRYAYIYLTHFLEAKQLLNLVWYPMHNRHWQTDGTAEQQWIYALVSAALARFCMELSQFEDVVGLCRQSLSIMKPNGHFHTMSTPDHVSDILRTWGRAEVRLGNYDSAQKMLEQAVSLANGKITKAGALFAHGMSFSLKGDYPEALTAYNSALDIYESCHEQVRVLSTLNGIGAVYGRQRQFEKAISYYEKVVPPARRTGQRVTLMIALNNMAFCLKQIGRLGRVGAYFEEALQVAKDLGKLRWQAVIAQDFGSFLLEQGQMKQAEQHIREGLELAATLSSQADVLAGLLHMAYWQAQTGHFVEAMVAVGYIKDNKVASQETQDYGQDLWDELSSELPPVFTQRAHALLETSSLDDVLSMMSR